MKKTFSKIIAIILIISSMLCLSSCLDRGEELYPMPKVRRDDIVYIKIIDKFESKNRLPDEALIPEEYYDFVADYIDSAVPHEGIIESQFKSYDYREIYIKYPNVAEYYQLFIFQKNGETFIEWSPDALTFNYELCKVDNEFFSFLDSFLQ